MNTSLFLVISLLTVFPTTALAGPMVIVTESSEELSGTWDISFQHPAGITALDVRVTHPTEPTATSFQVSPGLPLEGARVTSPKALRGEWVFAAILPSVTTGQDLVPLAEVSSDGTGGTPLVRVTALADTGELLQVPVFLTSRDIPSGTFPHLRLVPNPTIGATDIQFTLAEAAFVRISIHDLSGRLVTRLVSGRRSSGHHIEPWSGLNAQGKHVASGVYFVTLQVPTGTTTARLVLLP